MAISSTIENVNADKYANAHLPLPPPPEQAAIVRYLDYVDRRIGRYVAAKRKLIALLEEEKQAVVNRAVTRGLDPNVSPQALRRRVARRRAGALGGLSRAQEYVCSAGSIAVEYQWSERSLPLSIRQRGTFPSWTTQIVADDGSLNAGGVFLPTELVDGYVA